MIPSRHDSNRPTATKFTRGRREYLKRRWMIYRALESFDFKAASRAFAEANVCWKFKTGAKAPTAVQLRALAKELLEVVIDPRLEASVCCGGLNAVRRDDGTVELHLAL